jgi:hypothetical protein
MTVKSVAIFGDSWSVTSYKKIYDPKNSEVPFEEEHSDLNFQKLFSERNINVKNFSKGGNSNKGIINDIQKHKKDISDCDLIIVSQTGPLRDVVVKNTHVIDKKNFPDYNKVENLENFAEQLLCDFYNELSLIQKEIKKKILLIAGPSKIYVHGVPKNLDYIVPCWTKLTIQNFNHDSYFDAWESALVVNEFLKEKYKWDFDTKADFLRIETDISSRQRLWQTNDNFAWVHSSDGAYQTMFDAIMKKIGEINDNGQTSSRQTVLDPQAG